MWCRLSTRLFCLYFFFFFFKYYRGSHLYRLWRKYFPWTSAGLCSLAAATFSDCTASSHPLYSHPLSLLCRNHPHLQFPARHVHLPKLSPPWSLVLAAFISWRFPWLYNNAFYPYFLVLSPTLYPLSHWSLWHCAFHLSFSPLWGQGLTSVFSTTVSSASIKVSYA